MRSLVLAFSVWLVWPSFGCGRKDDANRGAAKGGQGAAAAHRTHPRTRGTGRIAPQDASAAAPDTGQGQDQGAAADSATGLAICDRYLKAVCRCAAKDPVLRKACDEGTKSAPRWKETSAKDPDQRRVVSESCRKALKMIAESFGCKD